MRVNKKKLEKVHSRIKGFKFVSREDIINEFKDEVRHEKELEDILTDLVMSKKIALISGISGYYYRNLDESGLFYD